MLCARACLTYHVGWSRDSAPGDYMGCFALNIRCVHGYANVNITLAKSGEVKGVARCGFFHDLH